MIVAAKMKVKSVAFNSYNYLILGFDTKYPDKILNQKETIRLVKSDKMTK